MVLSEYNLAGDALLCRFCSSFESAVSVESGICVDGGCEHRAHQYHSTGARSSDFVVFLIAGSKIQKIDEKILFIVFTVIYIIAGIYWIANVSTELRMDAYSAHNGSVLMRQHDFHF